MIEQLQQIHRIASTFESNGDSRAGAILTDALRKIAFESESVKDALFERQWAERQSLLRQLQRYFPGFTFSRDEYPTERLKTILCRVEEGHQ